MDGEDVVVEAGVGVGLVVGKEDDFGAGGPVDGVLVVDAGGEEFGAPSGGGDEVDVRAAVVGEGGAGLVKNAGDDDGVGGGGGGWRVPENARNWPSGDQESELPEWAR